MTLSPGVAPFTSQLTANQLNESFWHDANISFPGSSIGATVRLFNPKSGPVGLLRSTLVTVSLSSSSVGSSPCTSGLPSLLTVGSSPCTSGSSPFSSLVDGGRFGVSIFPGSLETGSIFCAPEYCILEPRLATRIESKENSIPFLVFTFVEFEIHRININIFF